jgi:hypothetical protein
MNFITQALSGMSGEPSTMRLCTVIIVICVMGSWTYTSIANQFLVPLSPEHLGLVLGALGIKAWQRGKETSPTVPETSTKPN